MYLKSKLRRIQSTLIGRATEFSLEARIYHSICIVAFFALAYNIPFNYLIGLPEVALISFIALSGFAWLYYISRIKKNFRYSVLGLGLLGNVFFATVYFLNSGINGPTLVLFALFFTCYLQLHPGSNSGYGCWLILL